MRLLVILICGWCVAFPTHAMARPKTKIAVAPLDGDPGNKIARAVVDALAGKDYTVVGPKETGREMTRLNIETLDGKATRKLASKLGVAAIIDGKVSKAGKKRSLHLEVHRRGKPADGFTVEFKSETSSGFRRGIHGEIGKKLDGADDDRADDDTPVASADDDRRKADADEDDRKRKADADENDRKRKADEDDRRRKADADADDRKHKALADDDDRKRKTDSRKRRVAAADDDSDERSERRRRRHSDDAAPMITARVGVGVSVAQRLLSWDLRTGFTQIPPRVQTTAGAGRVDGELYPFAIADASSSLAGLGLAAAYDKTFGLSIKVPNQTVSAPINQSHFSVGVRYRFAIGDTASVALGLDYAKRQYVAERGSLMGAVLDAPDVAYAAVSPGAWLRVPVTPSVAVFGGADGLLIFDAGGIQKSVSYGPANVYGLEGSAGVDIALAKQFALRIGLEYSQIMFTFTPKGTTLANNRDNDPTTQDVMGATDRSIGGAVTLGFVY